MINIYYDGACPFCSHYVRYLRLQKTAGEVVLTDVRTDKPSLQRLTQAGFDLDQGMVVEIEGRRLGGADAMQALALMSTCSGWFNKVQYTIFAHRCLALLLYPLLRLGRNLTLLLLGRQPLRSERDTSLLALFSACWGLFAVMHTLVYVFKFTEPYVSTYAIGLLGTWLFFHPESRRSLLLLLVMMVVDGWLHMPMHSNHTILKNFFLLAVVCGGVYSALRGQSWAAFFQNVAPVGRALLLIMYVFGVFHKINSGFLNPDVSCANALWQEMPPPLVWLDTTWLSYLTIYGTFIVEGLIFVFLLVPALRHWGIVIGIGFHLFLALSGYAFYSAFSMLSLTMHVLFLSPQAAGRIMAAPLWRNTMGLWRSIKGKLLIGAYALALVYYSSIGAYTVVALFWFAIAIPFLWLVIRHGHRAGDDASRWIFISSRWWLNVVALLFFFNCITPYLGLKTAQSMNMFANLRLEGGASNHLVLRNAPGPFNYLADVVKVESASGSPYLNYVRSRELHLTYYALLDHVERNPWVIVSYQRDGQSYSQMTALDLQSDMEQMLHPRWVRKWFHFRAADLKEPVVCENNL